MNLFVPLLLIGAAIVMAPCAAVGLVPRWVARGVRIWEVVR